MTHYLYLSIYHVVLWCLLLLRRNNLQVTLTFVINRGCPESGTQEALGAVCLYSATEGIERFAAGSLILVAVQNISNLNFSFTQLVLFALSIIAKRTEAAHVLYTKLKAHLNISSSRSRTAIDPIEVRIYTYSWNYEKFCFYKRSHRKKLLGIKSVSQSLLSNYKWN